MPLEPKKEPPYYNLTSRNTNSRILALQAVITTSGTTEENLYTYNIPENTLQKNGDGLIIQFFTNQDEAGVNHVIRFYINNIGVNSKNDQVNTMRNTKVTIVKKSDTKAEISVQEWGYDQYGKPNTFEQTGLDFTAPIPIKFTGECDTPPGTITTQLMTIDKQKI